MKTERAPRKLHIAVVTETYPPEVNGVARTIGVMVTALRERGHRIQVVRPRQRGEEAPAPEAGLETVLCAGIPLPRYRELRMGLPAKRALARAWRARRPDVVQALRAAHRDFVFAGMRTGAALAEHYASADVFLFPSLT